MGAIIGLVGGAATGSTGIGVGSQLCYMCGPCIMYGCCNMARAGATMTTGASCCLLLWLQVFAAVLGVLFGVHAESLLETPCSYLSKTGQVTGKWSDIGICACYTDHNEMSFQHQVIYRMEASALLLFLLLVILCISGCGKQGAMYVPCGKFLVIFVLFLIMLLIPNSYFDWFGDFARDISVIFLIGQTILVIDFAYRWNETWVGFAHEALRRRLDTKTEKAWKAGIIVCSVLFALFALIGAVQLCMTIELTVFRCVVVVCLLASLVLLYLSITVLDNSGGLLCSCVVMAYVIFLCHEAAASMPGIEDGAFVPNWVGLFIAAAFLIDFTFASRTQGGEKELIGEDEEKSGHLDTWTFMIGCLLHTGLCVFISAKLTPKESWIVYSAHLVGAVMAVALYGWTLVAPKVCSGRDFSSV